MAQKKQPEKPDQREWRMRKWLDAFGNMFGLNLCFVIASLPVITIGASLSATYAMAIRLQENEEETILHGFIHEFKRNFKQATIAWLLVLVAATITLGANILVNMPSTSPGLKVFYTIVFYLELLFLALDLAFLFPMIGRYKTTVKKAIINSFLLSVGYVWSAIKIIVAWVAPIALSIIYPTIFLYTWYLWLLLLFGAIIWGSTHTLRFVFNKNDEALDATAEQEKEKAKEKRKKEAEISAKRESGELPPKRELTGIASKANVLKAEAAKNAPPKPANANSGNKNKNNAGWYRGDKYNKNSKKPSHPNNNNRTVVKKTNSQNRNPNAGRNNNQKRKSGK